MGATNTVASTISSAFAGAQANLETAAVAMIVMVAVLTGIGLITSLLRK